MDKNKNQAQGTKKEEFTDLTKMLESKKTKLETGYTPDDFTRDYWLNPNWGEIARVEKDYNQVVLYFHDLFLRFDCNGTILDIGAGAGSAVNSLRKQRFNAYGCEFSQSGRDIAKERFNINLDFCDLRKKLPYQDDQFDWSFCVGVLSMIPRDFIENAISEILRITKFGVLFNVGTFRSEDELSSFNIHHLASITTYGYWKIIKKCGGLDMTSIQPPQKRKYGIGVLSEFAGLFSKGFKDK